MTMGFQTTGPNQQNGTICSIKTTFMFLTWIWRWVSGQTERPDHAQVCWWALTGWVLGEGQRKRFHRYGYNLLCLHHLSSQGLLDMLGRQPQVLLSNLPAGNDYAMKVFNFSITPKEKNNIIISVCWSLTHIYTHTQKMTVGQLLQTIFCLWGKFQITFIFVFTMSPFSSFSRGSPKLVCFF